MNSEEYFFYVWLILQKCISAEDWDDMGCQARQALHEEYLNWKETLCDVPCAEPEKDQIFDDDCSTGCYNDDFDPYTF